MERVVLGKWLSGFLGLKMIPKCRGLSCNVLPCFAKGIMYSSLPMYTNVSVSSNSSIDVPHLSLSTTCPPKAWA